MRTDYSRFNSRTLLFDDAPGAVADLVPASDQFRHLWQAIKTTIGAKGHLACQEAGGDLEEAVRRNGFTDLEENAVESVVLESYEGFRLAD